MLASFSCTNELANALIFTAAVSSGLRVFVPIFPEPSEFDNWEKFTGFRCVIMPFQDTLHEKEHEREKEVIGMLQEKCRESGIQMFDSFRDFSVESLLDLDSGKLGITNTPGIPKAEISPDTEAVIFTTSGTSGTSKLLVYSHRAFANCCQAWQQCNLFTDGLFGNTGFSPLFTHTIGIRTFINCVWSGNPFCIVVTDWFLHKPETARYLLMKMNPGHLISGPAFYNTMLELFRQYPELKTGMMQSLKAAISIGAPYDQTTALKFRSATGVTMMNALGTTETLMVTLNLQSLDENGTPESLGSLLPGVVFGLKKTGEEQTFELFINSIFQSVRTIGEDRSSGFFESGDLVKYTGDPGNLFYAGRKSSDFIKDEYGVKIPVRALQDYYSVLYDLASYIEWIPLVNIPGLAALIFVNHKGKAFRIKELASVVKGINEELKRKTEPFEYSHRHLERISITGDGVPVTRKGTFSKDQIRKKYEPIISELRNPFVYSQQIEVTDSGEKSNLFRFSNPALSDSLEALKLDKIYQKGSGDYLYYEEGEALQRVTDFVGGFGSNLLGHDNPEIRKTAEQFLSSGRPALNSQGSQYHFPALLARELNRIFSRATGKYFIVQFGNSGTEATELAIHHAYYEWRSRIEKIRDEQFQLYGSVRSLNVAEIWDRNMELFEEATPSVIVVNDCFHGYTSGARSLLGRKKQRYLFSGILRPEPLHLNDREEGLEDRVSELINENQIVLTAVRMQEGSCVCEPLNISTIIASVIEPVRGEGGIRAVNESLVELLARQDFPLISDEIQCGLGRTGTFPSCSLASYYLLGKSLGGGIEKISAVLIDDQRFKPSFTKYYSSTFANGELAACCGLATLRLIEEEKLADQADLKGERFLSMLQGVASEFPRVIESVTGRGLMIGIHFSQELGLDCNLFRILLDNELLGYLFAGWFLNNHHIRVLPSLSKPNTIRIEPSFYLPESEMTAFCTAMKELCTLCSQKKVYDICRYLMNGDPYPDKTCPRFTGTFPQVIEEPAEGSIKAGFIGNFTLPHRELQVMEPDFCRASDTGLRILFNRLQMLLEGKPFKIISKNIMKGKLHFTFYILPLDTSHMEVISRWGKKRYYISRIQEAVDKLSSEGVSCISLGAHTSIITGNGLNIAERDGCKVLTGNTLTVASCIYYLNRYIEKCRTGSNDSLKIAIIGASGNIGSGLVNCLNDPGYSGHDFMLYGNNEKRLQTQKEALSRTAGNVSCPADLFEVESADIIIRCVNTNDPVLFPHHLNRDKKVFIIDISVPPALSDKVREMNNVEICSQASSVFLPDDRDLLVSTHTPPGKIFCCAGESILTALHNPDLPLKGHIDKESVKEYIRLGINECFYEE